MNHQTPVTFQQTHDGPCLVIGDLTLRVVPNDNGVSFISNQRIERADCWDRPMMSSPNGFEGFSMTLMPQPTVMSVP
jgi:hypothetical protein